MKKLITLGLLCAILAIPIRSDGWVAAGGRGWAVAGGGGCWHAGWGCGGVSTGTVVAAGAAGFVAGATVVAATRPAVVVAPAPVVVAPVVTAPVYTPIVTSPAFQVPPAIGAIYYQLPYGAQSTTIHGQQYYLYGSFCYKPYFGGNGVYYEVVPYPV